MMAGKMTDRKFVPLWQLKIAEHGQEVGNKRIQSIACKLTE